MFLQVIEANTAMVLSEVTGEVGQIARTSGFSFSVERIANEDDIAVISANYITAEWKYKHHIMKQVLFMLLICPDYFVLVTSDIHVNES